MLVFWTSHSSASATRMPYSTAVWLTTGNAPGMAEQTGHTEVFGAALVESTTAHEQNIFDLVRSSAWTSSPMTGSNSMITLTTESQRTLSFFLRVLCAHFV